MMLVRGATAGAPGRTPGPTIDVVTYERITVEPGKMDGQPCIRGLRIPVATVVAMVADGMAVHEIITGLPDLKAEDIREALHFAAEAVR